MCARVHACQVILLDDYDLLSKLMPFIRCLNDYLVLRNRECCVKRKTVAYRVSRMSKEQAETIQAGETYRIGMYAATSSRQVVQDEIETWQMEQGMSQRSQIRWNFTIPKGCWQVTRIKGVSLHKDEHELLMVPYSAVRVRSKRVDETGLIVINADVLDDCHDESETLRTIVA